MNNPVWLSVITLVLLARAFDGVEQGLHWKSRPQINTGLAFHQADLFQTWMLRLIYAIAVVQIFGYGVGPAFLLAGLWTADQSIWQMALNRFANGHALKGELEKAEFLWWPDSPKYFRNKRRLLQLAIGIIGIAVGLAW